MAPRNAPAGVDLGLCIAAYVVGRVVGRNVPLPSTRNELKSVFLDLRAHPTWQSLGVYLSPFDAIQELVRAGFVVARRGPRVKWQDNVIRVRSAELLSSTFASVGNSSEPEAEGEVGLRRELRALGYEALTGHANVSITWPFPADKACSRPHSIDTDTTAVDYLDVTNVSKKPLVILSVFTPIMRPQGAFSIDIGGEFPMTISPGQRVRVTVTLAPQALGLHQTAVMFVFAGFKVVRSILVLVEDEVARASAPARPYVKPTRKPLVEAAAEIVPGEAPPMPRTKYQNRLPEYRIPAGVRNAVSRGEEPPVLEEELSAENYRNRMGALLHVEELQMGVDIQTFNMEGAELQRSGAGFLALKVPGLAEKRPSVLYGDRVFVHLPGQPKKEFEGCVHAVRLEEIVLKFHFSFHAAFVPGQRVNVRFTFNRVTIRREHEAIQESAKLPPGLLFPATSDWVNAIPYRPTHFQPINKELNEQQLGAVSEVLNRAGGGSANGCPYLVFGPPGTGKTNTCIEAMLQVLRADPASRILACAPSNFAADVILERLRGHVQKRELYRLNAPARSATELEASLLEYCSFDPALGHFTIPDAAALARPRVIISTCCSASLLHAQGLPRGHFSHVFVDEAGHARETEALIPIALFADKTSIVVLAGDHKQLGPIVRSKMAAGRGLETSYLERLAMQAPYLPWGPASEYHPRFITRLVRNYRSHPAILALPSRMFYRDELVPCADEALRSSLTNWASLPNRDEFPILFHGVEGRDEREGNSPSWFNPTEVSQVVKYVTQLIENRGARVLARDIGVISPYRKQVQKIDKQLTVKHPGVKVGSVEQFQGREKRVIIISTVRSSAEHIESDLKHNLGFLRNPKRFNVAVTRAQALLIIIGNPHVLAQDRCWGAMYEYCRNNGAYVGCEGPQPPPSGGPPPPLRTGAQPPPSAASQEEALIADWTHLNLLDGMSDDGVEVERPEWPEAK
ncbi:RNA helixase SDE3 [Klebsormidium nitens]|uniref:RNA helicase n=1 Tax=Klebsormidium nitens TaxID=105231 RepID=A0A0U9HPZ5_KLENI|nr:RNA helixase SDE3 [Klebsormidium nitens]|eukprot:GAQ77983.1 RNA helixase SDE3 [Klebsormidium nitens]